MKPAFISGLLLLLFAVSKAEGNETNVPSQVKNVTVYRTGAQLTHTAGAQLKHGDNLLIVENISNDIDVNSIQVKAPAAIAVLGVEFSGNYLPPVEKSARQKMLDDSLEHVQGDIDKIQLSITNTSDLLDVLKDNRNIKGEQSGLTVTELIKLMDYYKIKSLELQTELQQLNTKKKKLEELAKKISGQITEEQKKNTSVSGRLTLHLSAAMDGRFDFTISYIAKNAYWLPYYDIRVDNITSPVKLGYKAKIVQTTGIDWKQVKLSLSTSTPAQWGSAPSFSSWFLGYVNPQSELALQGRAAGLALNEVVVTGYGTARQRKEITGAVSAVNLRGMNSGSSIKPLIIVNGAAISDDEFAKINPDDIKSTKILKDEEATALYGASAANGAIIIELKEGLEDYISVADNTLNLTFDIDKPYDVPDNGKEQIATLQNMELPAFYKNYAVPKLDNDAYLLAEIPGWEKLNLLPGEANIILEGTYVGKSFVNPASTNDTLNLTLGRDERVAIKRQKVLDYSSVKFLASNKQQKFTYELTVRNNKAEAVNVILKDQYPLSTNKDIEVELLDSGGADVNSELGILNWKLLLAPGESKKIRFVYSVKYPKDKTINLN